MCLTTHKPIKIRVEKVQVETCGDLSFEILQILQKIPKAFEIYDTLRKELQEEEFSKIENEFHSNLSVF